MKSFRIGRASDNEMSVESPHVSRHHAELVFSEGELHVVDLQSSGGTFLNGARITRASVRIGDDLRLSTHCRFDWNSNAFRQWYDACSGAGGHTAIEELVIGRSSGCDVVLCSPYASKRHARLVKSPAGIELEDLDSRGGTTLDGRRVRRARVTFGDNVEFGGREKLDWSNPRLREWFSGQSLRSISVPTNFERVYSQQSVPSDSAPVPMPYQRARKNSTGIVIGTVAATLILGFGILVPTGVISLGSRASAPQTTSTPPSPRRTASPAPSAPYSQPASGTASHNRPVQASTGSASSSGSGSSSGGGMRYSGQSEGSSNQGVSSSDVGVAIEYGVAAASGDVIGLVELEMEHQGVQRVVGATAEAASDGRLGRNVQNATRAVENWSNEMTDRLIGW